MESREPRILKWQDETPLPTVQSTNIGGLMLEVFVHHGDKVALVDAACGKYHTYQDICLLVPRMSAGLTAAGVKIGDAVVVVTPNHIDYPLVMLAILHCGATCVPVSPLLKPKELEHIIRISEAQWIVTDENILATVEETITKFPEDTIQKVWVMGEAPRKAPRRSTLARLMRNDTTQPPVKGGSFDPKKTVGLMLFSSGTTGAPKGAMLSHYNMATAYLQSKILFEWMKQEGSDDPIAIVGLMIPMYHTYGHTMLFSSLVAARKLVIMDKFTIDFFLGTIEKYKVNYAPIVPHIAQYLATSPQLEKYDISSMVAFSSGTSALSLPTQMALMQKTGRGIGQGYGMTESHATITVNGGVIDFRPNAVGKVLPYFEVKIVDPTSGNMQCQGEEGEVCFRGPSVMMGYANNREATEATIDSEGWLHTGDLGYYDGEDYIYLTDRIKDLMKVKGYQVSPKELEDILSYHEDVVTAAVVGIPSERYGEEPRAWVVLKPGKTTTPQELQQFVAEKVIKYKQLTGGVEIVDDLPKNPTGKVLKRKLRSDYSKLKSKL